MCVFYVTEFGKVEGYKTNHFTMGMAFESDVARLPADSSRAFGGNPFFLITYRYLGKATHQTEEFGARLHAWIWCCIRSVRAQLVIW
jgi:hypothetical protein